VPLTSQLFVLNRTKTSQLITWSVSMLSVRP